MGDSVEGTGGRGSEPRRRISLRWKGHDYRRSGPYMVTVVAQGRACLFGEIVGNEMRTNEAGRMVEDTWREIPSLCANVEVEAFVVMPNHVHGILVIRAARTSEVVGWSEEESKVDSVRRESLSTVMQRFKSLTTLRYIEGARHAEWPRFPGKLWQRGFHDRVIRDDEEWSVLRQYIVDNPVRWVIDRENPTAQPGTSPILFEP